MKVCILTTAFPRWPGDERAPFIYEAARALIKSGANVHVLAMHRPGTKKTDNWDGIKITRLRYLPERWEILQEEGGGIPIIWKKKPLARFALFPFMIAQSLAILKYARQNDLLHANWTLSGFTAWLLRFIYRRPFIVTVHGSDIYQGTRTRWIRVLTKLSLSRADAVIAVSNDLAESLINLGVQNKNIVVIPDGINSDIFKPISDAREDFLLFVGSLIPRKGCKFLIQAFRQVSDKFPNTSLYLVGDGPDKTDLNLQTYEMGLDNKIKFLGTRRREEIIQLMQRAKLFVLPSLEEGLGVVLLEAIACGTPCVASQVGGIPDVITPEVGRLVPPGDPASMANQICELLDNTSLWQTLSLAARKRAVDVFDWRIIASQLIQLYSKAIGEFGAPNDFSRSGSNRTREIE